jgi:hypothetical protein
MIADSADVVAGGDSRGNEDDDMKAWLKGATKTKKMMQSPPGALFSIGVGRNERH